MHPALKFFVLALVLTIATADCGIANTILVHEMKRVPREVKGFSNDLSAEVLMDKKLLELFLKTGQAMESLTPQLLAVDQKESIQSPTEKNADGSESATFLLHGCNGVFTDEHNVVYFWVLSSPRILALTSEKYEFVFLVLAHPHRELLKGDLVPSKDAK